MGIEIIASLRFLYIFDRFGQLCAAPTAEPLRARTPTQPTSESGLLKAYYLSESGAQLIFHNLLPPNGATFKGLDGLFL